MSDEFLDRHLFQEEAEEMSQIELIDWLEENKDSIEDSDYRPMILDIIEKGKTRELSEKQRKVLNRCYVRMCLYDESTS